MTYLISRVEEQKRKKDRYNIFTQEGFLTSLSIDAVLQHGIKEGTELSEELLDEIKKEDTLKYSKEKAMEYIAYGPRSVHQVKQKLKQKGIDDKSIGETIEALEHYHYVDDGEFVKEVVKSYKNKLGRKAIVQKLREKGVSMDVIEENLELEEEDEMEAARAAALKVMSRNREEDTLKIRQKLYATLARKGFPYDMISKIISDMTEE